jgi:hypothetical protein
MSYLYVQFVVIGKGQRSDLLNLVSPTPVNVTLNEFSFFIIAVTIG